jgi:soluble lytic murein transglycosylase-like protein
MRKFILLATAATVAAFAPAQADAFSGATACQSKTVKVTYSAHYHRVVSKYGARQPGRNIRKYGLAGTRRHVKPSRCGDLRRSIRTFKRWLAPPVAPVWQSDAAPVTERIASAPASAGGRYAIPSYIVQCESGGDYGARNASGAYGAYQIMPGTAAAYGCSLATPAGQDACAAKIYAREGAGPWDCG